MAGTTVKGITIELNGDTKKLTTALSGVQSSLKDTQADLRQVERLLKLDPGNTELLAQKQRMLGDAVAQTKDKLEVLKEASRQANEQLAGGKISQAQYDALQREIIETTERLADLEEQARQSGVAVEQIAQAGEKLRNTGQAVSSAGEKLLPVTGAIIGAGTAVGVMATEFEDAMAKVSTIADTSQVSLDELSQQIMTLSNESGISAVEIAENVYNAISAGQQTGDAVAFVSNATQLARAGFTDSGAALDVLTTIMNAYGLSAEEVANVSDKLITTQNLGKTTVAELAGTMGKVIPTAKATGVNLDELCGAYAVMTANGIATAETTTYLNSMLNELGKQGSTAEKAFRKATEHIKKGGLSMAEAMESGMSLTDVLSLLDAEAYASGTTISNMFGSAEAGKAAAVLADNADKASDAVNAMADSAGATQTAYEKLETTSFSTAKTMNVLKNTGIEMGSTLLEMLTPYIERLCAAVSRLCGWLNGLSPQTKKLIILIAAAVAAVGPVLIVVGKVITAFGTLMTWVPKIVSGAKLAAGAFAAISAPVWIVIAAVAALIAVIAVWGDQIQAGLQKADDFMQNIFAKDFSEQFGACGEILNAFMASAKGIWDGLVEIFSGIIDFIRGVFTGDWERAWQGVQDIFGGIFDMLAGIAKGPINGVIGIINFAIDKINSFIKAANRVSRYVGVSFSTIPNIAYLAKGGNLLSGSAFVGENGPELLTVAGGRATVTPLTADQRTAPAALGGRLQTNVNVRFGGTMGQLIRTLKPEIDAETVRIGDHMTR